MNDTKIQRQRTPMGNPKSKIRNKNWWPWLSGILFIVMLIALWIPISRIGTNPAAIRAWLEPMGPLAPVAFFLLNVIQIVVAPIPGYPVQVLGGILFGFVLGAVYTVAGMTAGGPIPRRTTSPRR
jgi:uncharacterized membrane protein YdjX (TVP38/TMEM64 family)